MSLRAALDSTEAAKVADGAQEAKRDKQRQHIRDKLCDTDREFIDQLREVFPSARLVGIRFSDGEQIGAAI